MKDNLLKPRHGRLGTWLPADHKHLANWMTQQKQKLQSSNQSSLHPVIADFKEAIPYRSNHADGTYRNDPPSP